MRVQVLRLDPDVPLPTYARDADAGCDLVTTVAIELEPGERARLPTGIALALPSGYAGFVHPRSGLAARCGLGLVNAPGTIDAGYRGEIMLVVINHDRHQRLRLARFDRVAQLVVQRVEQVEWEEVAALPDSDRSTNGHGSSGVKSRAVRAGKVVRAGDVVRAGEVVSAGETAEAGTAGEVARVGEGVPVGKGF